jgi:hypothetical protein
MLIQLPAGSFECPLCLNSQPEDNVASFDSCSHKICFGCAYKWFFNKKKAHLITCPYCRVFTRYIFLEGDLTFRIPNAYFSLNVVDPSGRYTCEGLPFAPERRMLKNLREYEKYLERRGYYGEVRYSFQGVYLEWNDRLRHFPNVRDGDVVTAITKISIIFQYEGEVESESFRFTKVDWSDYKLEYFTAAFQYEHKCRTDRLKDFDYYFKGQNILNSGDYVPPLIDETVIVVRDHVCVIDDDAA